MKVKELIEKLQEVKDKEMPVVIYSNGVTHWHLYGGYEAQSLNGKLLSEDEDGGDQAVFEISFA